MSHLMHSYLPFYRSSWALVIGINDYSSLPPLNHAAYDAGDVAELLMRRFAFPIEQVILLQDEAATRNNILRTFDSVINQRNVAPDDRIMIYFAGHGLTRQTQHGKTVGYIAPIDAEPRAWRTLIRMTDLIEQASFLPAKHILFIMDACYSGLSLRRGASIDPVVEQFLTSRSVQVMTAGRADEMVTDGGDREGDNSVFTGYLLEALSGRAATASGLMTASDVMRYVYRHVLDSPNTEQTPQYGWIEGDGDFVFRAPHQTSLPGSIEVDLRQGSLARRMITVTDLVEIASTPGAGQSALATQRLHDVALTDPDPRVSQTAQRVLGLEIIPPRPAPPARARIAAARRREFAWLGWFVAALSTSLLLLGGLLVWRGAVQARASLALPLPVTSATPDATGIAGPTVTVDLTTPFSMPTPPLAKTLQSDGVALFQDDFSASLDQWEGIAERELITRQVEDSQLQFTVWAPYGLWISRPHNVSVRNARIFVDATVLRAEQKTGYGLVFRQVDFDNYYYYRINWDGTYSLILQRGGHVGHLIAPQPLGRSLDVGASHHVGVEMLGTSIILLFDGQTIASVQDSSLASGAVGLAVQTTESTPITVRFDNFAIYEP